jgi:hypothetical protein
MKHVLRIHCGMCGTSYEADLLSGWVHTPTGVRICGETCYKVIDAMYAKSIVRKHNTYHPELDEIH